MSKQPSNFRETDVKRLCRAVRAAGLEIARVKFDKATGDIVVVPGKPAQPTPPANDLDNWIAEHAGKT